MDGDVMEHDARDEPTAAMQNDFVNASVFVEKSTCNNGDGKNSWINSVDAFFVPIGEIFDSSHRFQKQCET